MLSRQLSADARPPWDTAAVIGDTGKKYSILHHNFWLNSLVSWLNLAVRLPNFFVGPDYYLISNENKAVLAAQAP
jgi:hypothetical protein